MARRSKTQRRRKIRGGVNPLKSAVLSMLALTSTQTAQGFPTWEQLKKPMTQAEINTAANEIVAAASNVKLPSLTAYVLPQIEQTVNSLNTWLSESDVQPVADNSAHSITDSASWMHGKTVRIVGEDTDNEEYIVTVDGDTDPNGRYAIAKESVAPKTGGKRRKTLRRKK
jgi:hypothetical protein